MDNKNNLLNWCIENNYLNINKFINENMLRTLKEEIINKKIIIEYVTMPENYEFKDQVGILFPEKQYVYI